ncbi:MAG: cytochrome C oxidase subunit IV family protein [Candidatus Zixiibacteriota bacterium]
MGGMAETTTHITPRRIYYLVAFALLVLTATTVWVANLEFGHWNTVVAMGVAVLKATLVALFFMHLLYDNKLYMVVFVSALLFLAVFIVFTMLDTQARGGTYAQTRDPIRAHAIIYDESGKPLGLLQEIKLDESTFEFAHGYGPIKEPLTLAEIDPNLAQAGSDIFDVKCGACHKLDERLVGPPLREVTRRRTPEFIMNMILNPDEMVNKHPEVRKLLAQYYTRMTFQNVTESDARALLEFLRNSAEPIPEGAGIGSGGAAR